ncbi:MFS transporter, partial [Aliivibrio salmonicida]
SYLTQFPNYTHLHLNGNATTVTVLLALFSIGIAIGSLACDVISKHKIELGIIPLGSLGISVFGSILYVMTPTAPVDAIGFIQLLSNLDLLPVFISLFLLGVSGGIFIVPLYVMIQTYPQPKYRSQIIAANNIYNALFMVGSALLGIIMLSVVNLSIPQFFGLLSAMNLCVTVYLFYRFSGRVSRFIKARYL